MLWVGSFNSQLPIPAKANLCVCCRPYVSRDVTQVLVRELKAWKDQLEEQG
jgi:hypothetical protein